jgi:hypothetical protein
MRVCELFFCSLSNRNNNYYVHDHIKYYTRLCYTFVYYYYLLYIRKHVIGERGHKYGILCARIGMRCGGSERNEKKHILSARRVVISPKTNNSSHGCSGAPYVYLYVVQVQVYTVWGIRYNIYIDVYYVYVCESVCIVGRLL